MTQYTKKINELYKQARKSSNCWPDPCRSKTFAQCGAIWFGGSYKEKKNGGN